MIGAVWAYDDNRAQARHIADRIADKLRQQPDAQIVLTAWSAGAAVAVWALEDLPDGVTVQSVLLVEPAVDPGHDLTRALRHVRGHLFATQSGGDFIMLGIGTMIFAPPMAERTSPPPATRASPNHPLAMTQNIASLLKFRISRHGRSTATSAAMPAQRSGHLPKRC